MANKEEAPRKKRKVLKYFVAVVVLALLYNLITGNSGGGIYSPKYQNGIAIIKVDNYIFNEDSEADWQNLCNKIMEASKKKRILKKSI